MNEHDAAPPLLAQRFDEAIAHGYSWIFGDLNVLAELVSQLLLGQHRHVRKILEGVTTANPNSSEMMIESTQKKLAPTTEKGKEHRDGWLFQLIAWIGVRIVDRGRLLISPPHDRPADKGFDALIIELEAGSHQPVSMMICEEKATDNPRNKFQQQVLSEFKACKAGERDTEIMSELTTMLEASHINDNEVDRFLELVMWQRDRAYRVCLTTTGIDPDEQSRARLFKDFDDVIPGAATLRRAEMFQVDDLRVWMDVFAAKVAQKLAEL
jgi:hypothetical protein